MELVDLSTILRWSVKSLLSPNVPCPHRVLYSPDRIISPHFTGQAGLDFLESSMVPKRGLDVSCPHQLSAVTGETPQERALKYPFPSMTEDAK